MIDKIQTTEAPNFIALDSGGRVIRPSDCKGKKNTVIVLNKSSKVIKSYGLTSFVPRLRLMGR